MMTAASHCIVLLAAALLAPVTEAACPAGTIRVTAGGTKAWCIRDYPATVTFCDAMKTCHANGEEMISKPVFDAMKTHPAFSSPSSWWWVAMTDSLNERGTSRDGWIWFLDGIATWTNDTDFYSDEPNNSDFQQDCVTIRSSSALLRDTSCNSPYRTFCFASDPPVSNLPINSARFLIANISDYMQPDPGCWIQRTSAISLLDCTLDCFSFGFGDCMGFYWNSARVECIILPYFDASVPLTFANQDERLQWRKFLRAR